MEASRRYRCGNLNKVRDAFPRDGSTFVVLLCKYRSVGSELRPIKAEVEVEVVIMCRVVTVISYFS
jgi:hypothetical protein